MTIKALVVDDSLLTREGIKAFLELDPELEVAGEAASGVEAIRLVKQLRPDVVLMDLVMPQMDGMEATRLIRQELPQIRILFLTGTIQSVDLAQVITAGASGCLDKGVEPEELAQSIKAVMKGAGGLLFSREVALHLFSPGATQSVRPLPSLLSTPVLLPAIPPKPLAVSVLVRLTPRENDILKGLAQGKTNREIAQSLALSEKTIKVHVSNLLSKLAMRSRTELALYGTNLLEQENVVTGS